MAECDNKCFLVRYIGEKRGHRQLHDFPNNQRVDLARWFAAWQLEMRLDQDIGATPECGIRFVTAFQSSYANVCNVSSTREEVVLAFGVNQ